MSTFARGSGPLDSLVAFEPSSPTVLRGTGISAAGLGEQDATVERTPLFRTVLSNHDAVYVP